MSAIYDRVQRRLLSELSPSVRADNVEEVRRALTRIFEDVLAEEDVPLSRTERTELFESIVAGILGFGPLEPFLKDETVTEILVNGPNKVYVERAGRLESTDVRFRDAEELMRIIDRIVSPLGRRVDESSPMVDARLPDGSRVNVIIPPLSLVGPCMSVRKFTRAAYAMDDFVRLDSCTEDMGKFLAACVKARLNIVISGGTSTGKTTLLNIVSSYLGNDERIVTIEDAAELQLQQEHVVRLEARPPNVEGKGQITIRQLVINALRMRPDRIVVGEVRGGEALDMLQAMNTGHDGSLDHSPLEQPARHAGPRRDDGADGRHGPAAASHPRADRVRVRPGRAPGAPARRHPQDHPDHRSAGHGRRCHRHAGHLPLRADGDQGRPGAGLLHREWDPAEVHGQDRDLRHLPVAIDICAEGEAVVLRPHGILSGAAGAA